MKPDDKMAYVECGYVMYLYMIKSDLAPRATEIVERSPRVFGFQYVFPLGSGAAQSYD